MRANSLMFPRPSAGSQASDVYFLPGWDVPKLNPNLFTDHFGLVSDFLSECLTRLRGQSRVSVLQGRISWGGALSGYDLNGVNKTVSGLLKLMYPDSNTSVADED
ncbi:MAG: BREX system Lon protease-like protein BrxL [Paralcaligenes sp.]